MLTAASQPADPGDDARARKAGGSYRANQVRLLGADTPAAVYDLVKQRRDECFSCLSPGYMASRLYFVKQWIWFCLEVAEVSPIRKWTGSCDDFEDGLIEAFVLTCSCRFVTWGSINQARMHVVEPAVDYWSGPSGAAKDDVHDAEAQKADGGRAP